MGRTRRQNDTAPATPDEAEDAAAVESDDDTAPATPDEPQPPAYLRHTGAWRALTPIQYLSTATGGRKRGEIGSVLCDLSPADAADLFRRGVVEPELRG